MPWSGVGPEPAFVNYFIVGFNDEEFVIQHGVMYEGQPEPRIVFTLVTTPGYARRLRDLLSESLEQWQEHDAGPSTPSAPVSE